MSACLVSGCLLLQCSNTFLEMPVVVHEFVTHAVAEEEMQPQPLNSRAKLWRALMPPDQLNPMGFIDGDIQAFMPTQVRHAVHIHNCVPCVGPCTLRTVQTET
jgi:hypothetical protein